MQEIFQVPTIPDQRIILGVQGKVLGVYCSKGHGNF